MVTIEVRLAKADARRLRALARAQGLPCGLLVRLIAFEHFTTRAEFDARVSAILDRLVVEREGR